MGPLPIVDPILKEIHRRVQNLTDLDDEAHPELGDEVDLKRLDTFIEDLEGSLVVDKKTVDRLLDRHRDKIEGRGRAAENLNGQWTAYFESLANLHSQLQLGDPSQGGEPDSLPATLAQIQVALASRQEALAAQTCRVAALRYMHQLYELQRAVKLSIASNRLHTASLALKELGGKLEIRRPENLSRAAQQLQLWAERTRTQVIGAVDAAIWGCIVMTRADKVKSGRWEVVDAPDGTLAELAGCLELLDSVELVTQPLVAFLERELILPLLQDPAVEIQLLPNGFELVRDVVEGTSYQRCLRVVKSLRALFETLCERVPRQLLPADFYERRVVPQLRQLLSDAIPTSRPGLVAFSELAGAVSDFEAWVGLRFSTDGALSDYVAQAERLYLDRKRDDLLSLARAILLDESPGLVEVQESELQWEEVFGVPMPALAHCPLEMPLLFPRCRVPDTVPRLISAIEATLMDAATMNAPGGLRTYMATRSVIDLYLAMAPARVSLDPNRLRGAAILHNESFYLGHLLLSLGYRFRSWFPCTDWVPSYLDFFPALLALAHKALALPLARHQEAALRVLQDLDDGGFRDLDQPERARRADAAVTSALEAVDELAAGWRPLLPPRLFEAAVGGQVLLPICHWVVDQILDLVDIGEKDSYQLQAIAFKLVAKVADLLPHTTAQARVPAYLQLELLSASILTGSLAHIKAQYGSGAFRGAFTDKQLAGLVLALFGASPSRNEFVTGLLESEPGR
ncbi:Centromere/kinetochore protein zw10 [Massospora cicadina]|nr:Centromere/kinetochore protein zw10 [Massospora cicadina]